MGSNLLLPNVSDNARAYYSRAKAIIILDELSKVNPLDRERWLAGKVNEMLAEYQHGLEQMVNVYHRQACDALNLKLPEPFVASHLSTDTKEEK